MTKRRRLDCKDQGCGECQMCRYLDFLEWAGQVAGSVPSTVQRNPKLDAILAANLAALDEGSPQ